MTARTEETIRVHVILDKSDWEALRTLFGGRIGQSQALRTILSSYIRGIRAKAAPDSRRVELSDDDLANLTPGLATSANQSREP